MPTTFSFDANFIVDATPLERGNFTTGFTSITETPSTYFSAIAPNQSIATSTGVDVFSMAMVAGQSYYFDIANAALSLEFEIIDLKGNVVARGSDFNDGQPDLRFDVTRTGSYFVAVHYKDNDYIDGSFGFDRSSGPTGSYKFGVSTSFVPSVVNLSDSSTSYTDTSGASRTVKANGGNDWVSLGLGNDIGLGGSGNDQIYGGSGFDELSGGTGLDTLEGGSNDDVVKGGTGADLLSGNAGNDSILGGADNDRIYGDTAGSTSDTGNDLLWGEGGNDVMYGGSGNDVLRGGAGADVLYGGSGLDTFHFLPTESTYSSTSFSGEDRIVDFARGSDRLDLTDLSFGVLSFRSGGGSFTGTGQVRVDAFRDGNRYYQEVQVNLSGGTAPELAFLVHVSSSSTGYTTLTSSDFLL